MRISDWSSDVCSSDLAPCPEGCRRESIMTLDDVPGRSAYDADHEAFRETVRSFLAREGVPNVAEWEANRLVPKEFWRKAGAIGMLCPTAPERSEEHTSELQSLMRISYAVFCLKKKKKNTR